MGLTHMASGNTLTDEGGGSMNTRICSVLALSAALLACDTAQAAEWVSITALPGKNFEVLVDVSSIQRSGEITRAWIKYLYAPHTERGAADDSSKWKSYSVQRYAH